MNTFTHPFAQSYLVSWPQPQRRRERAGALTGPIAHPFLAPIYAVEAGALEAWAWAKLGVRDGLSALVLAVSVLLGHHFPPGTQSLRAEYVGIVFGHLLAAMGIQRLVDASTLKHIPG